MFITTLLFILILYLAYHYYVHYGRNGQLLHKIPGPSGYPIIGNILQGLISTGKEKCLIHFHKLTILKCQSELGKLLYKSNSLPLPFFFLKSNLLPLLFIN